MRKRTVNGVRVGEALAAIEAFAPARLAAGWDNVGLQLGDASARVRVALVAFEATDAVLTEARRAHAELVVAHHPLIFHPLKSLRTSDPQERRILEFVRAGIAFIAAHTNLDHAPRGLNHRLVTMLGLTDLGPLIPLPNPFAKLVTFVPLTHEAPVRAAMAEAGAGRIGNYSHCSFRSPGLGTFLPQAGAQPALGTVGALAEVEEVRLEMIVPGEQVEAVIAAMRRAHPYEEVAFDVYPLQPETVVAEAGIGRLGRLPKPLSLRAFARRVGRRLAARHQRIVGDEGRLVTRVAVCTGAGAGFIETAARAADLYITGDVKHHDAMRARELGLAVIDPGHAATERHAVAVLAEVLEASLPALRVIRSRCEVEPFH